MILPALAILWVAGIVCGQNSTAQMENELLHFSYKLEQYLDTSRQPCQDFYGYVCSRSANLSQTGRQRFQSFLKGADDGQLMDMEVQLVNLFRSCETGRGAEALKGSQLYRMSGGWPALEAAKSEGGPQRPSNQTLSWLGLLSLFHEVGAPYFFETVVTMQSNKRVVVLQPDTTRRNTLRKFEQRVGEVLQSFGIEQSRAHVAALEVLSLERARRDIVKVDLKEDEEQFSYGSFKQLRYGNFVNFGNASVPRLDWDSYFRKLLGGKTPKDTDTIVVKQVPRLIKYFVLLQNTSMHRLLNWIWTDYLMDIVDTDCHQLAETYAGDIYAHVVQRVTADRAGLAQMYATLGKAYSEQLVGSVWIDEISQVSSRQFLGQLMHLTLNGDERLDAAYHDILLGRRSFYRNLEKLRRFQRRRPPVSQANKDLREFAQVFATVNALLGRQNLSSPLNYLLLGEHFSWSLLAAGSNSRTPGAWRSSDSERRFNAFRECIAGAAAGGSPADQVNPNDLLLGLLAQRQALRSYRQWLGQPNRTTLQERIDSLLAVGRLKMSLQKLYFVGSLIVDCRSDQGVLQQERKRQLTHAILRNSREFGEAFQCRPGDALHPLQQQQRCNPL
ncbi:uncharacterized protein Dana_GF16819 [Drosophila ananassae]|uniref:Peptidase M13 N-terminal domain-containing protein n=1 Tax=Drosophila ananassae TaxID=7217 RepID=B3LXZ7_DROAN|nr:uncharacterized protein LOC6499613 [Drosophila ananassae]EDV42853.1 uncharacterized protein Dana_GF16819 [Drosophila ananassae]